MRQVSKFLGHKNIKNAISQKQHQNEQFLAISNCQFPQKIN
jgi:hypothetical protein